MPYTEYMRDIRDTYEIDELMYLYISNSEYHLKSLNELLGKIFEINQIKERTNNSYESMQTICKSIILLFLLYRNTEILISDKSIKNNYLLNIINATESIISSIDKCFIRTTDKRVYVNKPINMELISLYISIILYYDRDELNKLKSNSEIFKGFAAYIINGCVAFFIFSDNVDIEYIHDTRLKMMNIIGNETKNILFGADVTRKLESLYYKELDKDQWLLLLDIIKEISKFTINPKYNDSKISKTSFIIKKIFTDICQYYYQDSIDSLVAKMEKYLTDDSSTYHIYTIIELIKSFDNRLKKAPVINNRVYYKFTRDFSRYITDELFKYISYKDKDIIDGIVKGLVFNVLQITTVDNKEAIREVLESYFNNDYNTIAMEADGESIKKSISRKTHETKKKIYAAYRKYKDNEEAVDNQLTQMANSLKDKFMGDTRTEIIEGKKFTILGILKHALSTAAIFSYNKIGGILFFVARYALRKNRTSEEKKKIILELEMEIKILEEKIQDAASDGDREAKYNMMRTKGELEKTMKKIQYGATIDDKALKAAASYLRGKK